MILALYAIGDLHLSFGTNKPMDIFGGKWKNHPEKTQEGFKKITSEDLCVICGDISWAMNLDECLEDLLFIERLPGKKIILKGNHDYWWSTVTKIKTFFSAKGIKSINILYNNCFFYEGATICGTRGWFFDDELTADQNKKISVRESLRLLTSLKTADQDPQYRDNIKICFFHYPPRFNNNECHDIISIMNEYNVKKCIYGHLHGTGHQSAVRGLNEGIEYEIVSADY